MRTPSSSASTLNLRPRTGTSNPIATAPILPRKRASPFAVKIFGRRSTPAFLSTTSGLNRFREGEPIFSHSSDSNEMTGAYIWLTYDAHDVSSDEAIAEIFTPDGQHVTSTFDLSALR